MTATIIELEHGTPQAYRRCTVDDGRACEPCRKAAAAYEATRRRSPRTRVAAGKVRTHILDLQCHAPAGPAMSLREIASTAGTNRESVRQIAAGEVGYCDARTRAKILGVLPPARQGNNTSVIPEEAEPFFDDPLAGLRLLLTEPDELAWKADAECARLDISVEARQRWFFPMRGEAPIPAKSVCARCPVWSECLTFALTWNMDGIWGRSAGSDRRKLVRHDIAVDELVAVGMGSEPGLAMTDAIDRVVESRQAVA